MYSKLGNFEEADSYYEEVIKNALDADLIATAYVNKGYFQNDKSSIKKIPYYLRAFDILLDRSSESTKLISLPSLEDIRSSTFENRFFDLPS